MLMMLIWNCRRSSLLNCTAINAVVRRQQQQQQQKELTLTELELHLF